MRVRQTVYPVAMTPPSRSTPSKDERTERLAAALRENLKRRKAQSRSQEARSSESRSQESRSVEKKAPPGSDEKSQTGG